MPRVRRVASFAKNTLWYGKHELTHLLMGVSWVGILTYLTPDVTTKLLPHALIGSLFPDIEHVYFHLFRNKKSSYSTNVKQLLKQKQISDLIRYVEENHKTESFLPFHNIFVLSLVITATVIAFANSKEGSMVFLGAVALHYIFDIIDDVLFLGKLNPNWTRGVKQLRKIFNVTS